MSRSVWSFYDQQTGLLTGRMFLGLAEYLVDNTPAGCSAIKGRFDHRSQRVDIQTGTVVDDQALAEENRRSREQQQRRDSASQRIAELERRQARPQRELQLDPNNNAARERLVAIDLEIAQLRSALSGETDTTAP